MSIPILLIVIAGVGLLLAVVLAVAFQPAAEVEGGKEALGPFGKSVADPRMGGGGRSQTSSGVKKRVSEDEAAEKSKEKLRERLIHAGLYKKNSLVFYYLIQISFAAVPVLMLLIGHRVGLLSLNVALLMGIIFGILGVIGPGLWLDYCKAKRQTSIRRSIPDALDVINICVEAGMSLNGALVRVSKELSATYPLLAMELIIVHRQVQMGKTSGEALRSFAERFDLSELRSLASVVKQSERFGAGISAALRTHGETLRAKRMQSAHEKAQKAATWILLPTVLCIFPALFVVILGPAAYDIMEMMENMNR